MFVGRILALLAAIACFAAVAVVVDVAPTRHAQDGASEPAQPDHPADPANSEDADPVEEARTDVPPEESPLPASMAPHASFEDARSQRRPFGEGKGVGPRHGHLRDVHRPPEA